ncbi:MAG: ABC transporter substrate-binding protein [Acidimicrobiales bacterium]|nr:ABC transporter substrate-binding protein [Acidimicrobiales bacterium]
MAPDLDKARDHLEKYKQETGQSELSFDISFDVGSKVKADTAATLQQQWAQIGVKTTLTPLEQTQFLAAVAFGNYQMSWFRNFGWKDPDFNYIFWHSSTANPPGQVSVNFTQTKVPALDTALDTGRENTDDAVRTEAYGTAFRELNRYASHLWLYYATWAMIARDTVAGLDVVQRAGFARQDAKTWWTRIWLKQ